MNKKKKTKVQMIDMSGRLQVKIVEADENEKAKNKKDFDDLNNTISEKIQEINQNLDEYIEILFEDSSDEEINITESFEYYNNMFQKRNNKNVKEKMEQYQSILSNLNKQKN